MDHHLTRPNFANDSDEDEFFAALADEHEHSEDATSEAVQPEETEPPPPVGAFVFNLQPSAALDLTGHTKHSRCAAVVTVTGVRNFSEGWRIFQKQGLCIDDLSHANWTSVEFRAFCREWKKV